MTETNIDELREKHFHKLYGNKRKKIKFNYNKRDFVDYVLMCLLCIVVLFVSYGGEHFMTYIGSALCLFMVWMFHRRYGFSVCMPLLLKEPLQIFYLLLYKIQNMKAVYFVAIAVLLLENLLIYLTPSWPHKVELMRQIGFGLLFFHFALITAYRSYILYCHLQKKALVKEVLDQTVWKGFIARQPSITLDILHAYFTGVLTHIILIAPWYIVLTYANFSVLLLVPICFVNLKVNMKFLKVVNAWYYRDHWLGHNHEMEFVYLHGPHHDAIPSGLIGVAGNGFLEGFFRHTLAFPTPFFHPLMAALFYTIEIKQDIDTHQYIPGIFPQLSKEFQSVTQHSTHHFGRLEPYGFGIKIDQPHVSDRFKQALSKFPDELLNSADLETQLNGFKWDNPKFQWYMEMVDKYSVKKEEKP